MTAQLNDKQQLRVLREKIAAALASVEREEDIKFTVGGISYRRDGSSARIKLSVATVAKDGTVADPARGAWARYAASLYDLPLDALDRQVVIRGKVFTVAGLALNRPKNPVKLVDPRGGEFFGTVAQQRL